MHSPFQFIRLSYPYQSNRPAFAGITAPTPSGLRRIGSPPAFAGITLLLFHRPSACDRITPAFAGITYSFYLPLKQT